MRVQLLFIEQGQYLQYSLILLLKKVNLALHMTYHLALLLKGSIAKSQFIFKLVLFLPKPLQNLGLLFLIEKAFILALRKSDFLLLFIVVQNLT